MEAFTSVWDITSAKQILKLKPNNVKVPSACNNNWNLMTYIFKNYKKNSCFFRNDYSKGRKNCYFSKKI